MIYLPASDRTDLTGAEEGYKTTASNAKILIMDDESYLCDIITQMLGHLGHHVEVAQDGSVACDKFRSARDAGRPFDLVILDLTVPGGMGGVATITELKKLDPKVVAIASSGYSDDPVMAQPDRYGFVAKINKPYIHDELAKVIDTALAQNQLH